MMSVGAEAILDTYETSEIKQKLSKRKKKEVINESNDCSRWCCLKRDEPTYNEDAYTVFGRFVADELKALKNKTVQDETKMKINEILFSVTSGIYDDIPDSENTEVGIPEYSCRQFSYEEVNDHISSFGRYVSNEIRFLTTVNSKQIAKMKICEALFNSSVKNLATE